MQNINSNILDISRNHYNYLLNLKNVHAVGLGYKMVNNKNTFKPCIHVLVEEKVHEKYLSKNNIIPKTYMGIKTDVIKMKKFKPLSGGIPQKLRPLESGCSISPYMINTIGTLGCIVTKYSQGKKSYFILSNAHVLSGDNDVPIGTPIIQPAEDDDIEYEEDEIVNTVALLSDFVRLNFQKKGKPKLETFMDAAIAKIVDYSLISNKIYSFGKIKGVSTPYLGQKIQKVGSTSGHTTGKITTIGASETVYFGKRKVLFKDQIIADLKHADGDSGSIVLNDQNEAVALLFAGTDSEATMTNIKTVLNRFNVEIFTGYYESAYF